MSSSSDYAGQSSISENCNKQNATESEMDVAEFSQRALQSIMTTIKQSNELVSGKDDYDFYNSFSGFNKIMNIEGRKVKQLMKAILTQQGIKGSFEGMDLDDMFESLVEANDVILERVRMSIDEVMGLHKKEEPVVLVTAATNKRDINTGWNRGSFGSVNKSADSKFRLLAARNIVRPQLRFRDKIDNSANPFEPILKEKYNALKPMSFILEKTEYGEMFTHPYQFELDRFEPLPDVLQRTTPQKPKELDDTPYTYINTVEGVETLLADLKRQKEFAVDLEHHSYRSYQGITCLMQISTRDTDYLVDTLELRSDLQPLNEVFTDPKIVKVFHGADSDIGWLQRCLGIYVVNMFDTGQASRVFSFAHFSLAYLLKHYCNVDANKAYQLADWRIRPLPSEMVRYAREDTHYLLYIYDLMKNELLTKGNDETNLLLSVFQRSKEVCEKRYEKPAFHPENYTILCQKSRKLFNSRQLNALSALYAWRDRVARQEDECTGYILPNHMLLQIAEVLPREMQGILACCNPIPAHVRQNLNEIHSIILQARDQSLVKQVTQVLHIQVDKAMQQFDMDNVLSCPHDFGHSREMNDGPTLLDIWSKFGDKFDSEKVFQSNDKFVLKTSPKLSCLVGHTDENHIPEKATTKSLIPTFDNYASPFKRYILVQPMELQSLPKPATTEPADTNMLVSELKDHFSNMAKIHGGNPKAQEAAANACQNDKQPIECDSGAKVVEVNEPLRKKMGSKKKKKAQKKRQIVDVAEEPEIVKADFRPKKKAKKAAIDMASFKSFNYDDVALSGENSAGTKKEKKKVFQPFKMTPKFKGKNKGKNRKVKQSVTYSTKQTSNKVSSMAWPK